MNLNMYYDSKKNKAFAKKMIGKTSDYYVGISKICANCGKAIIGHSAISRKDNKTEICSHCGTLEALEAFENYQREVKIRKETIIETSEVNIGTKLILKNGKEAIVQGYWDSMLPTITKVYQFKTNIGIVLPDDVERIVYEKNI